MPRSGRDPRIQDTADRIANRLCDFTRTFWIWSWEGLGQSLMDLMNENHEDLQAQSRRVAGLEEKLLERMEQIKKLERIIFVLSKEVYQAIAIATAHAFRRAKETNDQEHNEDVNNLKNIERLEADIRQLQESLAEVPGSLHQHR